MLNRSTRDVEFRQAVEEEEDVQEEVAEEVEEGGDVINDAVDVVTDVVDEAADNLDDAAETLDEAVDEAIDDAVDALGDNAVGDAAEGAADAASDIGEIFQEIIASVGEVLEDTVPPSAWNYMCLATWWPLHEEHCQQARCAACAPAVTTASAVCKRSFGPEGQTHKCVQTVMGEGFCNYCIDDYL